jgi:hypothetical protein
MTRQRGATVAILVLAGILRFTGLSWGLRHAPVRDEQDFVENTGQMIAHRDLDHRFYEYPGLFFDLLYPVLAVAPPSPPYTSPWDGLPRVTQFGPTGYLAARGLVAAFGVLSVALVMLLGSRMIGPSGGLVAGALLAVSPVEVFVAHDVRPDVVLETFVLLAFLAYRKLGERDRDDLLAGAATGAAAAVKFTGILLVPSWLIARGLATGRRVRGTLLAGLAALVVWVVATPYAILAYHRFVEGALFQVSWHYREKGISLDIGRNALFYVRTIAWSLGPVGAFLGLAGLVAARREGRAWAALLAYVVVVVAVLSTATVHWHRLVLSALGLAALVAARGFAALAERAPRLSWAVAGLAVLLPLGTSTAYVRSVTLPGTRDLALDWIEANVPPGARVLSSIHELGVDRKQLEVIEETTRPALDRRLAQEADLVVWHLPDRGAIAGFETVWQGEPRLAGGGFGEEPEASLASVHLPVILARPTAALRTRYRAVPLAGAAISASSNSADARLATDGRLDTSWSTARAQAFGDWFDVVLEKPIRLGRVELSLGSMTKWKGESLQLSVSDDGVHWRAITSAAGRARVEEQPNGASGQASQVLVTEGVTARGVSVRQIAEGDRRWGFAEIRIDELLPDSPE